MRREVNSGRWEVLAPLSNGDFVRLWLANGLWWQAMWMEMMVLGWLALDLTDSPWWVQVVGFYRSIPLLFIGLFGSVITDRYKRRHLVLVLQTVNVVGAGILALLLWLGRLEFWHLSVVALVLGSTWALDWPTRRSLIPDLVGKERTIDAMVLENLIQGFTRVSGPLAAGYIMAAYGNLGALFVLVSLGGLALISLAGLKTEAKAPQVSAGVREAVREMRQGWAYVRATSPIFGVVLITIFMNIWAFPYMSLLPVFARDIFGQGPEGMGWLGAASGVGAFSGLALVHLGRSKLSNEWLFVVGSLLSALGVAVFAIGETFTLSLALLFCSGLGQAGFSIMQSSIILVEAPDEMRGRAMSALVVAIGIGPFGRLQSGAMAEVWGARVAVGVMALMAALGTLGVALIMRGFIKGQKKAKGGDEVGARSVDAGR
ncbi:MAG: MFS transporter [Candidatus Latescibacterota bacterium]|nr:MFS transporter [Candidatus Latescibacterota bacterium]